MKPYLWRILLWLDQGLNTVFLAGSPDETVSSHCWRHQHKKMIKIIDWLFSPWEKDHCKNSLETNLRG